jgi:acetylornithine/succinyldiaminopimelate/putrescine aminotransferase
VAWDDLDELERAVDESVVAGVLLEPIQGEGGVNPPSPGFLPAVRRLCDERGALLMLDEIQTGLGRTGRWFAFQHEGIAPDVVTVAKALGNGVPIGACWARGEVAEAFKPGDHGSTFGGQPLAAAAAKATLAVMEEADVPALATVAGAQLRQGLADLPGVTGVRGRGLLLAAELETAVAKEITARALAAGLVVNAVTDKAVRLAPPLLVSSGEIHEALAILRQVLGDQGATGAARTGTA